MKKIKDHISELADEYKKKLNGKIEDRVKEMEDSIYAFFIVNAVSTVAMFMISFYEHKFKPVCASDGSDDDLPF